jgi:hypothetical protein
MRDRARAGGKASGWSLSGLSGTLADHTVIEDYWLVARNRADEACPPIVTAIFPRTVRSVEQRVDSVGWAASTCAGGHPPPDAVGRLRSIDPAERCQVALEAGRIF